MNERKNSPECERAPDLIAFLYDEASAAEVRDFQLHLQECSSCRDEAASFGLVRGSITAWRDEALSGFVSTPLVTTHDKKSARVALRQFFTMSPLWLKAATAVAALMFCVLAGLVLIRRSDNQVSANAANPGAVYTEQDVNRIVAEALARQEKPKETAATNPSETVVAVNPVKPKTPRPATATATQSAKSRRPLSRAERDQLAAELRLLSTSDEASLNLIGDRINQ